jgi:signal transduction histidine kinase
MAGPSDAAGAPASFYRISPDDEAGSATPGGGLERRLARLRATQLERLVKRSGMATLACAALALPMWLGALILTGRPGVLAWAALVHAAQGLQWAAARAFKRQGRAALVRSGGWMRAVLATLALSALAWGSSAFWVLPALPELWLKVGWIALLFGVAAAGAYAVAVVGAATLLWLLPLLGPLIGWLLAQPGPLEFAVALLALAQLATACFFAAAQHRLLKTALQTKLDNDTLVRALRQQVALVERTHREKSRFLAAASHDLRQPMHALGLFAGTLETHLGGTALQPTVSNMMRTVDALEQSFNAMLDISKLDAGVVEPNLRSFPIRDLFRLLHMHCAGQAEALGLGLRFKPGGKLVTSDPQLLQRVLANLVVNALRNTTEGGVVVVVRQRRGFTSIEVWDTGIGISADELPRVFEEFYQVANPGRDRSRGLGMGLAIVKRLVLLMGHGLEVRSHPGRGTVFRVLLKPTELAELDNVVLGADTVPSLRDTGQTLLLIDDEESVRTGMRELLGTWGYRVLVAGTIAEACAEVVRHADVIDFVVSDLRLADGEDGIDAIERVRAAYGAPLPALLVTGDTSPEQVKRAHLSGHPVLFKPVRPRDLRQALRGFP